MSKLLASEKVVEEIGIEVSLVLFHDLHNRRRLVEGNDDVLIVLLGVFLLLDLLLCFGVGSQSL